MSTDIHAAEAAGIVGQIRSEPSEEGLQQVFLSVAASPAPGPEAAFGVRSYHGTALGWRAFWRRLLRRQKSDVESLTDFQARLGQRGLSAAEHALAREYDMPGSAAGSRPLHPLTPH